MKYIIAGNKSFFFCAFDSYGTNAYSSNTFTGIYSKINLPVDTECCIYKKDWTDKLLRTGKCKTGVKYIDDNLTITSTTKWIPRQVLSQSDVNIFLEIHNSIAPLKIIIQHDYFSLIGELKDKTIIGIETKLWLYEDNDLDTLIGLGGQLIENITRACN
jgi:hypothetical protein